MTWRETEEKSGFLTAPSARFGMTKILPGEELLAHDALFLSRVTAET